MFTLTPSSTLFPYTTLFRSTQARAAFHPDQRHAYLADRWRPRPHRGADLHHPEPTCSTGGRLRRLRPPWHHPHDHHRRSEEHTSELQSRRDLVCRLLLEKKK